MWLGLIIWYINSMMCDFIHLKSFWAHLCVNSVHVPHCSLFSRFQNTGVKRRFGNKEVDRSLYGKRDYASKNPLLSPIFETASTSLNSTPTPAKSGKQIGTIVQFFHLWLPHLVINLYQAFWKRSWRPPNQKRLKLKFCL